MTPLPKVGDEHKEELPEKNVTHSPQLKTDTTEVRRNSAPVGHTPSGAPKKTAFVQKLYNMLNDPKLSHLIWWSRGDEDGVFALHPCTEFATALTTYFKHGNVSSFVRQLHMYGFHKVFDNYNEEHGPSAPVERGSDDLIWEFRHSTGSFRKGDEESLSLIKRRSSNRVIPEEQLRLPEYPRHMAHQPQYYYPVARPAPAAVVHYAVPPGSEQYHPQGMPVQIQQSHPQQPLHYMQPQPYHPTHSQHHPQAYQMPPYPQHPHTPQPQVHHQQTSAASTPQQQQQQLPQHQGPPAPTQPLQPMQQQHMPQYSHSAPTSRQVSVAVPPEQQSVVAATQELAAQQRDIGVRADQVSEIQRATTSDVLKIGDQLPKIAPVLKKSGHRYSEPLGQLQQSFNQRAESCTPEPPSEQPQQQHQVQPHQPPHGMSYPPHQFAAQAPGSVMMNSFQQAAAQRNQSIHFWERSSARQPSVFVDPLHAHPSHASPLGSTPSSPSQSAASSSQRSSTVSTTAIPPAPFQHPHQHYPPHPHQHPLAHQQHLQEQLPGRNANSVPHIFYAPNSPTAQSVPAPQQRRTDSLPTQFPPPPPGSHGPSAHSRQFPPRSVPDDHLHNLPHQHHPQHLQSPQQPGRAGSSIPNMTHLTSRLRPSLLEFYNNNPPQNGQTTSLSSNSTYSTLYSAHSSISSISSRNSQGSFSGIAHDALAARQLQGAMEPPMKENVTQVPMEHRQSVVTVVDEKNSNPSSVSKVAVSSLLSSPGVKEEGKKRSKKEDSSPDDKRRNLKKVKSTAQLRE